MKYLILFAFIISFSISNLSPDKNLIKIPDIRLTLDGSNLGDLEIIALTKIKENHLPLGTIKISEDIPILGKLDLILENTIFKITNISDADIVLYFEEEKDINFIINLLQGEITFDYKFETGIISGLGNATMDLKNLSLALNNTIIQVPNEYEPEKLGPGIKINYIGFKDFDLEISFSKNTTFEKLIRYFNKNLKSVLISVAQNELKKQNIVNNLNENLYDLFKKTILHIPIDNLFKTTENINISFSMNEEPIIKNSILQLSLEAELKGENYVYEEVNNITLPHIINDTKLLSNKTINSVISQFLFNNILDALFFFGKLNLDITNDTIGMDISVGLISGIIKEIQKGYSASQKVKIMTKAVDNPILKISEQNKLKITLFENLKFFVYNNTNYLSEDIGTIPVDANSNIEIEANFNVNHPDINLVITSIRMLTFEVQNSLVGDIDTEKVKTNFKNLIGLYMPTINQQISSKIAEIPRPLNIEGVLLNELFVQSYEDYLKVDLSPIISNLIKYFKY